MFRKQIAHQIIVLLFLMVSVPTNAQRYEFTDSYGRHFFENVPQRVVITDWTLADQLLPLGIMPIGMPEIDGYKKLIARPELTEGVIDVGHRRQLDLRKIRQLEPDVVILGTGQKFYEKKIAAFSRVNFFQSYSSHYRDLGEKAIERFMQLAKMFQKEARAQEIISNFNNEIAQNKQQLAEKYTKKKVTVAIFRFSLDDDVIVYGENSLSGYVLNQLGLINAYQGKTNQYGDGRMSLNKLVKLDADFYCYIEPIDGLTRTDLNISIVKLFIKLSAFNGQLCVLPQVNSYGGVQAMSYMQDDITRILTD